MLFSEAATVLNISLRNPDARNFFEGVSIDTRTLKPGNLFVALPGMKVDGHSFLDAAFNAGAAGALVAESYLSSRREIPPSWRNLLSAADPEKMLASLAAAYRQKFSLKMVAITGSVGKTSTKEFLKYLLSRRFPVLATEGNLNNQLGLPLTLFQLRQEHRAAVLEMGASRPGDIRFLSRIAQPDHAIITGIAPAHLEGFGSLEGIYQTKLELIEGLGPGAVIVLPDHDPVLLEKARRINPDFRMVGESFKAHYRLSGGEVRGGYVHFQVNGQPFAFPGLAGFLARNAAMAIAMVRSLGMSLSDIPEIWEDFKLPAGRFQEKEAAGGIRFIFDGYNANPASFQAAVEALSGLTVRGRRAIVFSDMLELGEKEKEYHEALGRQIAESRIEYAAAYGPRALWSIEALKKENPSISVHYGETASEIARILKQDLRDGDCVLLKASRGMKIEEILKVFEGMPLQEV